MAHHGLLGEAVERLRARVLELAEQALDVERQRRQARRDLPFPHLARLVPVDLDAVTVGVVEVQRLADEVIRQPGERDALAGGVRQPAREVGALGEQQREVKEPGVAARGTGPRLLDEHEQLALCDAERGAALPRLEHAQPDAGAVEAERALQVGHRQVNGADRRRGRDFAVHGGAGELELFRVKRRHRPTRCRRHPPNAGRSARRRARASRSPPRRAGRRTRPARRRSASTGRP